MSARKHSLFTGAITTSGNSHAIRFEAALAREHPEFATRGNAVHAHYLGPGRLLIAVDAPESMAEEADPVLEAWLSFLARDMREHPERLAPLTEEDVSRLCGLTEGVRVDDADDLGEEDVGL